MPQDQSPSPNLPPPIPTRGGSLPADDDAFGRTLIREGILAEALVKTAIRTQKAMREEQGITLRLRELLVKQGHLTPQQVKQVLALQQKTLLTCLRCGMNFNVKNWRPGHEVFCPKCSGQLVPPRAEQTIEAHDSHLAPAVAAAVPDDEHGGKPFGRYRLLQNLGQGGMKVVWKAWDTELKRIVALGEIKTGAGGASPEDLARFLQEARSAAKLRHPAIVHVHDVGVIDGRHYFTMDCVLGTSLDKTLERLARPAAEGGESARGPRRRSLLPVRRALEIVKEAAEALDYAHQQGIVHRDVKPANIMIEADATGKPGYGRVLLTDFGLAKDVKAAATGGLTMTGAIMGTPMYMSPEQASGSTKAIGPRSDVFSLGVVLYELLAGRVPFNADSLLTLLKRIADDDPLPPTQHTPRLHRDVEAICLKALEKDPAQRYPSAAELADDIDRYLEGEPVQARAPGRLELLARQARRHKIVLQASAAVAAIALLAWGLVRLQSSRAASEVADAHTKVQEEKKQYQEKIAEITKGIEDLKKDRDHRKAGQAYEEMLKGATTDEDRRKLTGQIEDAKIMEDLHARLVKSVAETRKKGETLHTTDGKEVSGDVLMADQEMVILYADGRSVEVPWSKVRTADYDRFLRTYLSEPDDETAFALGIYAQSQGDYEWARRSYLLVPTDAKLRTRAEAKLAELGYETESARETRLKMERDRDEEERERQARQKAEQTFRKIVTDAEKLAREHDYDRALAGLKAAARNPEMMSLSRKFEGEMQVLEHGRKGWLMRAAGLTDWIGKEIVIPRGKSSLRGNLESLESSGTLVLSGPTAEARVRVKWEDLSDNLRSEAVSAALRRDASLALPYVLCRVLDGDLEAAERLEYLFPETTAFGLPETEPLAERLVDRGILFRYFGQLRSRADLARSELFERGGTVYSREHLTVSKDLFGRSGRAYTAEELRALGLYGRSGVAYTLADLVTEGLYGRDGVALTPDELRERQLYEHDGLAFTLSEALSQGLSVGPFASRFGTLKQSTLKSGGGTAGSEEAVRGALCWLARHQNPDGSWSAQTPNRVCGEAACGGSGLRGNDVGVTALALLTFLGAGCFERSSDLEHFSKKHQELNGGEVVSKATAWLVSKQDADGCVGGQVGKYMYNHLAGTLALVEASALSESSSLRQAAQSAVDFTLAAQNPYKGWRYGKRCGDNDTSVTGWAIMALKSASLSTLKVGQAGFDGAKAWIMEVADDTYYKAGYTSRGTGLVVTPENQDFAPHEAITAIAMMCRMCIDRDWTDPALEGGAKMLMDDLPTWDPVAKKIDFYYWHYGTLALYQYDGPNGPHWTIWNKAMISALVPNQRTAMDMCAEGSWDADTKNGIGRWAFEGGRVYTTAMAALTLETCYRYPSMFPSKDRPPGPSETSRKPGKTK